MADGENDRRLTAAPATRWLIVVFLAVIATCLMIEVGRGAATAETQASSGRRGGIFAVAGQVSREAYGLFLVDTTNNTMCVYRYLTGNRKLQLVAARNFSYDLQLDDYNTTLSPREVKQLVAQQKRITEAKPAK